jgi:hypothetical protein
MTLTVDRYCHHMLLAAAVGVVFFVPAYGASLSTFASATCSDSAESVSVSGPGASASCGSIFNFQGSGSDTSEQRVGLFDLHSSSAAIFNRTEASGNERGPSASGFATFVDVWTASPNGQAIAALGIPWFVTGTINTTGHSGATVTSGLDAFVVGGTADNCSLNAPGTCIVVIAFTEGDSVRVSGNLTTLAQALGGGQPGDLGTGTATANFSGTAQIGPVEFFDATGRQIFGITLTDDSGFQVPVAAAVPESKSSLSLLSGCVLLFVIWANRHRRVVRRFFLEIPMK